MLDAGAAFEIVRTPGFMLAGALIAPDWKRWSLAVNAANLFDKHYYADCSVRSACSAGYARNVIATPRYRF